MSDTGANRTPNPQRGNPAKSGLTRVFLDRVPNDSVFYYNLSREQVLGVLERTVLENNKIRLLPGIDSSAFSVKAGRSCAVHGRNVDDFIHRNSNAIEKKH